MRQETEKRHAEKDVEKAIREGTTKDLKLDGKPNARLKQPPTENLQIETGLRINEISPGEPILQTAPNRYPTILPSTTSISNSTPSPGPVGGI